MNSRSMFHQRLVGVADAAALYQVSERTIWRMVKRGRIPAPLRLGARATRWRLSDLLDHIGRMPPHHSFPKLNDTLNPEAN